MSYSGPALPYRLKEVSNMPLVFTSKVLGRTIKPVGLVLMNTMLVLGCFGIFDLGLFGDLIIGDILGTACFVVATLFAVGWIIRSQRVMEWALLGACFIWGIRFWAIIFITGSHALVTEGAYMAALWTVLAGVSWRTERIDVHNDRLEER